MIKREDGEGFPLEDYEHEFVPGYHRGSPGGKPRLRSSFTGRTIQAGPRDDPGGRNQVSGWDFVVCELDPAARLGDHWGWMPVAWGGKSFYQDKLWISVGYPASTADGEEPSRHKYVEVIDVEDDEHGTKEIETHDAITKGWSGGPLFTSWDGSWVVGGVASGREYEGPWPVGDGTTYVYAGGKRLGAVIDTAYRDWTSLGWTGWQDLGGQFHPGDTVAAVSRRPWSVELFVRGMDNQIWQNNWPHPESGDWSGWFPIAPSGVTVGSPGVVSGNPDHLQLFIIGTDHQAWSSYWLDAEGRWSGWHPLGGQFRPGESVSAISKSPGLIELFVRGLDSRIWQNYWPHPDTGDWSGWFAAAPGRASGGPPEAIGLAEQHLELYIVGIDHKIWTAWWTAK